MSNLILIDGHAILHRAYHALPPLTNKDGIQTNAVYGFVSMVWNLLESRKPEYLVVAFDLPTPTFRMQIWTQYQEKRPEMESNLKDQIPLVHELLDVMKVPHFAVAGYEADDVIGTLAKQATIARGQEVGIRNQGKKEKKNNDPDSNSLILTPEVVIVTGDRDMLQLVNEKVKVLVPVKGLAVTKLYDEDLVKKEFGVSPNQWVDVKALKGDSSDNYPGVLGIGPKTAQDLIAKYGTLENVYKNLDKTKPSIAQKLAHGTEMAGLSQKLARILTDVPIKFELEKAAVGQIDWEEGIRHMRTKLGFRSIVEKIERRLIFSQKQLVQTANKKEEKKLEERQMELF